MAFTVVGGAGGGAPLTGRKAHVTFDYDQTHHPHYALLQVGAAAGSPPGLCLALTMAWLQNWKTGQGKTAYNKWVGAGGGGDAGVLANMVGIFNPANQWVATTGQLMAGMGFHAQGGLGGPEAWMAVAKKLPELMPEARYMILMAHSANAGHAMGLMRTKDSAHFFDPNHGEIFFQDLQECATWLTAGKYRTACLGNMDKAHWLQFS